MISLFRQRPLAAAAAASRSSSPSGIPSTVILAMAAA
jgi:hypothetical protein